MKKKVFGKKLKRDTNERKGLFKSLISSLVLYEKIKTTKPKAQAIRSDVEKLVTKLKNAEIAKARMFQGDLEEKVFNKLYKDISPRFKNRNGGYTRIIKIGNRVRDNAETVILEWVEKPNLESKVQNSELKNKEKLETETKIQTELKKEKKPTKKTEKKVNKK